MYGLSDRGLKYCAPLTESFPKSFDEHSARTLDHELEISYFHFAIKSLCKQYGWQLYWQQADLKTKFIHPDALFAITDGKKPDGRNTMYYFLEIERSKIGHFRDGEPSIIRKLEKYYDHYNSLDCQRDWNFKQFRVVVVQRTLARADNLLRTLSERFKHRMFWITAKDQYKRGLNDRIFRTPKDYNVDAYGFLDI